MRSWRRKERCKAYSGQMGILAAVGELPSPARSTTREDTIRAAREIQSESRSSGLLRRRPGQPEISVRRWGNSRSWSPAGVKMYSACASRSIPGRRGTAGFCPWKADGIRLQESCISQVPLSSCTLYVLDVVGEVEINTGRGYPAPSISWHLPDQEINKVRWGVDLVKTDPVKIGCLGRQRKRIIFIWKWFSSGGNSRSVPGSRAVNRRVTRQNIKPMLVDSRQTST